MFWVGSFFFGVFEHGGGQIAPATKQYGRCLPANNPPYPRTAISTNTQQVSRAAGGAIPRRVRMVDGQSPGERRFYRGAGVCGASERDFRGVGTTIRSLREGVGWFRTKVTSAPYLTLYRGTLLRNKRASDSNNCRALRRCG